VVPAASVVRLGNGKPRVLVVDRHELFIAAIGGLLTGAALNAEMVTTTRSDLAGSLAAAERCDVVVCGFRAGTDRSGTLATALAEQSPAVPLVLLGEPGDERELVEAFRNGVAGIFTKTSLTADFVEGVAAVIAGHRAVAAELLPFLLQDGGGAGLQAVAGEWVSVLSPTELGILAMLGEARSVSSIAIARGVSQKTVRNHVSAIYRKLGLRNRVDAVIWAARTGLNSGTG
jgi:DNA-binding NarL/FixJ family response regulator